MIYCSQRGVLCFALFMGQAMRIPGLSEFTRIGCTGYESRMVSWYWVRLAESSVLNGYRLPPGSGDKVCDCTLSGIIGSAPV